MLFGPTGASVAARPQLGDESFVGTNLARGNAPIKGTFSFFVQHAEGDTFSQAISTGNSYAGQSGWVAARLFKTVPRRCA
jgi:hypothetical protein